MMINNNKSCLSLLLGCAGLPSEVKTHERVPRVLRSTDFDSRRLDVFACVKQYLSDTDLAQDPILVFPQSLKAECDRVFRLVNTTEQTLVASLSPDPRPSTL